jgi:hypothetical protein
VETVEHHKPKLKRISNLNPLKREPPSNSSAKAVTKRVETCILKSRNYTSIYRYISGDYDESCFYTSGSVSAIPDAS